MRGLVSGIPVAIVMWVAIVAAYLALTGCATIPAVSCDQADTLRTAARLTLQTLDRVCPMGPQ